MMCIFMHFACTEVVAIYFGLNIGTYIQELLICKFMFFRCIYTVIEFIFFNIVLDF
jgi:hypothetical protein